MDVQVSPGDGTSAPRWLGVDGRADANVSSAVGTNVVLVCAELSTLRSDTLELLLSRSIRIADLHKHAFISDCDAVVLLDDVLTLLTACEA